MTTASSSSGVPAAAVSLFMPRQLLFLINYALISASAFTVPSAPPSRNSVSVLIPSSIILPSPHARGVVQLRHQQHYRTIFPPSALYSTDNDGNKNLGVIDLTEDDDDYDYANDRTSPTKAAPQQKQTAPFLSQGEMSTDPNLLSPDFNDAKQTRVIIYIILTLLPVLFLVPLMIGSRDLIPLDALPPVELN